MHLSPPVAKAAVHSKAVVLLLSPRFFKKAKGILLSPPSVRPSVRPFKYHLISITKSISKIFIPYFVCVLTNERYKTYQTGFSLCSLGHAPGVGLWGAGGA